MNRLTAEQIDALADFAADGADVVHEALPDWMTRDLPTGGFEPLAARVELQSDRFADAVHVKADHSGPCPTVSRLTSPPVKEKGS